MALLKLLAMLLYVFMIPEKLFPRNIFHWLFRIFGYFISTRKENNKRHEENNIQAPLFHL